MSIIIITIVNIIISAYILHMQIIQNLAQTGMIGDLLLSGAASFKPGLLSHSLN